MKFPTDVMTCKRFDTGGVSFARALLDCTGALPMRSTIAIGQLDTQDGRFSDWRKEKGTLRCGRVLHGPGLGAQEPRIYVEAHGRRIGGERLDSDTDGAGTSPGRRQSCRAGVVVRIERADAFVRDGEAKSEAEPLAMISTYLRGDRNLSAEAAEALDQLVKATYERMRKRD